MELLAVIRVGELIKGNKPNDELRSSKVLASCNCSCNWIYIPWPLRHQAACKKAIWEPSDLSPVRRVVGNENKVPLPNGLIVLPGWDSNPEPPIWRSVVLSSWPRQLLLMMKYVFKGSLILLQLIFFFFLRLNRRSTRVTDMSTSVHQLIFCVPWFVIDEDVIEGRARFGLHGAVSPPADCLQSQQYYVCSLK